MFISQNYKEIQFSWWSRYIKNLPLISKETMNMKNIRDIAERRQVWNIGFVDIEVPISSKNIIWTIRTVRIGLTNQTLHRIFYEENHYLLDLLPAFGFLMIRFIMRVGSDSINVLLNPAGTDFELSHSIHWKWTI